MIVHADAEGIAFLESEEGKVFRWYRDFAGIWTCLTGHRRVDGDLAKWPQDHIFTQAEDDATLANDLRVTESALNSCLNRPIGQNMVNALCSLGFNIGTAAERHSTVMRILNTGGGLLAADAFRQWNKVSIDGKLVVSPILTARRERERAIFLRDVSTLDDGP